MMPPLYRLLSLRYLIHRWDRAALIVASIALGVATLVSSRILNQCIESAATATNTPLGVGDLFVTNGDFGVNRSVVDDIRAANISGVKSVQPLVVEKVTLPGQNNRAAILIGVELTLDWLNPQKENPLGVKFTKTLEENWATAKLAITRRIVVLSKSVYDEWVLSRKDPTAALLVKFGSQQVECLPAGYFECDEKSPVAMLGKNVVGMEIVQAARFVRAGPTVATAGVVGGMAGEAVWDVVSPARVNRIDVLLEPNAKMTSVQSAVQAIVRDRAEVKTPESQGKSTQEIVSGLQIAFTLCSATAMIVGLFLVYNALAVTVAERRHDIGILRSIGATRSQIVTLFAVAALVLGVIGAGIGVPLGTVMARSVLSAFRDELGAMFLNPASDPAWPSILTIGLAMLAGISTAVFAALIPAIQAATQDPADAVRRVPGVAGGVWQLAHRATCGTLIAVGVAMILTRHDLPPRLGAFGGMMTALIGLLLAAPILVGLMVRLVHPILRRILPIEARLAADNLLRSPGRTGVVIGALGAGVAVMIQTAGVGRSNQEPVVQWLDEAIQADRFIFSGNLAEAIGSQNPLDPQILKDLAKLPGVEGVAGLRYVRPDFNGTIIFLTAIDAVAYVEGTAKRIPQNAERLEKLKALSKGNVIVISDNFALRHGVNVGDAITLPGSRGPVELRVIDTVKDYSWSRGTIYIDRTIYAALFQDHLVDVCHVYLHDPTEQSAGSEAVATFAADKGLVVQGREAIRKFVAELMDRIYTLAYLQQIVVGIVAALGVVTALLISVLQRKRELGLLLAVGATPGQVVRSVIAEALLMGGFGVFFGILIGLPMEWYILRVVFVDESGFVLDLIVPWREGINISVGALGTAMVAGLLPALHAVRTRIPEAIAYE